MAFFQNVRCVFHIAKIDNLKFEFPAKTVDNLFKFQAQDSDLEFLFWQCEKHTELSEKKPPLGISVLKVSNFQNEFMKSYFGRNDDFINSF